MIALKFQPPNFCCDVELGTDRELCLAYGVDEAAVRARFTDDGYTVHGVQPYDFAGGWKRAADEATTDVINHGKPAKWDNTIWRDIKAYLFLISHSKCGYCESPVRQASKGEVEHYRPKGMVSGDTPAETGHPGYYWLAYDVSNYIPTCSSCNTGKGKKNQFPIRGIRAQRPADSLALEDPLLLNPFTDDPRDHLKVHVSDNPLAPNHAVVVAKNGSPKGDASRKVYDLDRADLLTARRQAMEGAQALFMLLLVSSPSAAERFKKVNAGGEAYTAAAQAKLDALFRKQMDEMNRMRQTIGL